MSKDGLTIDESDLSRLRNDVRQLRPLVDIVVVSSHYRDGLGRPLALDLIAQSRQTVGLNVADEKENKASMFSPISLGPQFSQTEAYQKQLAHQAIDSGARYCLRSRFTRAPRYGIVQG